VNTVVARSSNRQRGKILALAGATRVVYPEAEMGDQLAAGKSLQELRLRQTHGINVIAIQHRGVVNKPVPEAMGDVLLVAGRGERVASLARLWDPGR